jgi:hypothetical protein
LTYVGRDSWGWLEVSIQTKPGKAEKVDETAHVELRWADGAPSVVTISLTRCETVRLR